METKESLDSENKQQKLEYIKHELELLRQCCLDNNANSFKTRKAAEPFLKKCSAQNTAFSLSSLLKVFLFLGLAAVIFSNGHVRKLAGAASRRASVSVLSIWDWRRLHDIKCFLDNPYKEEPGERIIGEEECKICANMTSVTKLEGSTMEEISEDYLKQELPVIVTTDIYRLTEGATLDDLYQLFVEDEILRMYAGCDFDSNIKVHRKNHRLFLKNLHEGKYDSYYAHWQNCFKDAAKLFRQVYKRPEFLPSTVEVAPTSWVFVSSNYTQTSSLEVPIEESVVILIQLSGYIDLILKPKTECQPTCKTLTVQLMKGSVFILTDLLYNLEYRPSRGQPAITVGLAGTFDL